MVKNTLFSGFRGTAKVRDFHVFCLFLKDYEKHPIFDKIPDFCRTSKDGILTKKHLFFHHFFMFLSFWGTAKVRDFTVFQWKNKNLLKKRKKWSFYPFLTPKIDVFDPFFVNILIFGPDFQFLTNSFKKPLIYSNFTGFNLFCLKISNLYPIFIDFRRFSLKSRYFKLNSFILHGIYLFLLKCTAF